MNKYPVLFEELFVFKGSSLTSEAVVNRLTFPTSMDNEEKRVDGFLTEFLMASSQDTLKMFLTFVTGAPCLPYFGLQTLSVKFSDQPSLCNGFIQSDVCFLLSLMVMFTSYNPGQNYLRKCFH